MVREAELDGAAGAREPMHNMEGSFVIIVDYGGGGTAQALMAPMHQCIFALDATTAPGAKDSVLLSQRP